jgi:predicted dehydrogenase
LPCDEWHHNEARTRQGPLVSAEVPAGFDYDFWLGHTPVVPYAEKRCHFWWRFNSRYGGGELTDRGAHVIDIVQLALGTDATGPVEFHAEGTALTGELYDAFLDFQFENRYANGLTMTGRSSGPRGLKLEGSAGSIFIHIHGGKLEAEPASLLDRRMGDGDVYLGRAEDHRRNFFECVRSRKEPFATAEIGHRTATICHLNQLAMRLGRSLTWDPQAERVVDDPQANKLLTPTMRPPWRLGE